MRCVAQGLTYVQYASALRALRIRTRFKRVEPQALRSAKAHVLR